MAWPSRGGDAEMVAAVHPLPGGPQGDAIVGDHHLVDLIASWRTPVTNSITVM